MKQPFYQIMTGLALAGLLGACSPPPAGKVATLPQIKAAIRHSDAPLTLVHVWATWCDPCREEFPELLRMYEAARRRGLELILVSADDPAELDAVDLFLQEQQSPVGSLVATELSQDFIELFSSDWAGALPASFFFDADGQLAEEWQGKRTFEEYMETIDRLLNKGKE